MKIDPKDRSQLLSMAGNIAGGMKGSETSEISYSDDYVIEKSVELSFAILEAVDKEIAERNKDA